MAATTIILNDEHKDKLKELVYKTRSGNASNYLRNLIDRESLAKDNKTVITGLKVISNMLQGRIEGNISTASDEKILESVEDLIKYMEG